MRLFLEVRQHITQLMRTRIGVKRCSTNVWRYAAGIRSLNRIVKWTLANQQGLAAGNKMTAAKDFFAPKTCARHITKGLTNTFTFQMLSGTSTRDYSAPNYVTKGDTTYKTLPGSTARDYRAPTYVIENDVAGSMADVLAIPCRCYAIRLDWRPFDFHLSSACSLHFFSVRTLRTASRCPRTLASSTVSMPSPTPHP